MNEMLFKKFNATNVIIESLPKLIEAFVTYYGEEERKNIEEKFNNAIIIGCCSPNVIKDSLRKLNEEVSDKLINEFLENKIFEQNIDKDKINNILLSNYRLDSASLHPINYYINYLNGKNNNYYKEKTIYFLENFYPNVNQDNLDDLIQKGAFNELDVIVEQYEIMLSKYEQHLKEMKKYRDYIEKCEDLKTNLNKKYTKMLVEELKEFFTKEEYEGIQEYFDNKYYYSLKEFNGKTKNLFGYKLDDIPLIAAFSEESEQLLLDDSWRKDSIISSRISYFKNLGLDLGNDYGIYELDERAKALVPSKKIVSKVLDLTETMKNCREKEYYMSLPDFINNLERINSAGIVNYSDAYNENTYINGGTYIATTVRKIGDTYSLYPIVCISMNCNEFLDHNIVHEFNHIFESSILSVEGNKYYSACGWDISLDDINIESNERIEKNEFEKRNYELFNEIINELISQEICEILFNSNNYIFNNAETAKIVGYSSYESYKFLVLDFFNAYKTEIIESRKTCNLDVLFKVVGKENFEKLNNLCNMYNYHFGEFKKKLQLSKDLQNGETTELTEIFYKLQNERDKILENMNSYSNNNKINL